MSIKKIVIGGVISLMILTLIASSATEEKGKANDAGPSTKNNLDTKSVTPAGAPITFPQMAWGRYGPITMNSPTTAYYRIYFGGYFSGSGVPVVVETLEVPYNPYIGWGSVYSLGADLNYTYNNRFDARLTLHAGNLTNAFINWYAIK